MASAPKLRRRGNCGLPARDDKLRLDPPDQTAAGLARGGNTSSSRGRIPEKKRRPGRGLARQRFAPAGAWTRRTDSPRRRVSPGPPTGQALVGAEAALRNSPEPLCRIGYRVRLACPTERLRGEPESAAVYRFTSRTDEATPLAATERTPLMLRALFGSSRVREDLPRPDREVGRCGSGCADHSPTPADTRLIRRSRGLWCGQRKRDLGSPWAAALCVRLHRTPRSEIDQMDFQIPRRIFPPRIQQLGAPAPPRGTAFPNRSRYTRARVEPAGGSGRSGGKSLPAADPSIDVAR